MNPAYVDTSLLAKLYTLETDRAPTARLVQSYLAPLPLTEWQKFELRTALRLKVFRREIDAVGLRSSLQDFAADVQAGLWRRPDYAYSEVYQVAENLSQDHAATIGCRTLDVLRVVVALVIGAQSFLTSDSRQAKLATQAGLIVPSV